MDTNIIGTLLICYATNWTSLGTYQQECKVSGCISFHPRIELLEGKVTKSTYVSFALDNEKHKVLLKEETIKDLGLQKKYVPEVFATNIITTTPWWSLQTNIVITNGNVILN